MRMKTIHSVSICCEETFLLLTGSCTEDNVKLRMIQMNLLAAFIQWLTVTSCRVGLVVATKDGWWFFQLNTRWRHSTAHLSLASPALTLVLSLWASFMLQLIPSRLENPFPAFTPSLLLSVSVFPSDLPQPSLCSALNKPHQSTEQQSLFCSAATVQLALGCTADARGPGPEARIRTRPVPAQTFPWQMTVIQAQEL